MKAGAHFVILDFINVTEAGGSLFPMVAQICSAVAWIHDSAGRFGEVVVHYDDAHYAPRETPVGLSRPRI